MEADGELMLEDARSIREGLWRMARYVQDAAEALGSRIEDEDLDGLAEAVEVREALERLQALSLEVSEELDAYQQRHARQEI
jgi:valyl-tRNA synthetase